VSFFILDRIDKWGIGSDFLKNFKAGAKKNFNIDSHKVEMGYDAPWILIIVCVFF
jgi:hypothetical protein